jgi:hypothetical protein
MFIGAVAGVVALLTAADFADAKVKIKHFKGTRDQVRAACAEQGGELIESPTHTTCLGTNGRGVTCGDDGNCVGTSRTEETSGWPAPAPTPTTSTASTGSVGAVKGGGFGTKTQVK